MTNTQTVDVAEATTHLAQSRVALTTEDRLSHLDQIETLLQGNTDPRAIRILNESRWMR